MTRQRGAPASQPLATQFGQASEQLRLLFQPCRVAPDHFCSVAVLTNVERVTPLGRTIHANVTRLPLDVYDGGARGGLHVRSGGDMAGVSAQDEQAWLRVSASPASRH